MNDEEYFAKRYRFTDAPLTSVQLLMLAQRLAESARCAGFILTIEQHSMLPPAMGTHEDVVTVRRARTDGGYES